MPISDHLKKKEKKPSQTSLSCSWLWNTRKGTSFPPVLSCLLPFSSLRKSDAVIGHWNDKMPWEIWAPQNFKTLWTWIFLFIFLSFFPFFFKKKKYNLSSLLCKSFQFHFSPAWQEAEVGISTDFTSCPSPHISGQQCFSFHQWIQNLTWRWLEKATVLLIWKHPAIPQRLQWPSQNAWQTTDPAQF